MANAWLLAILSSEDLFFEIMYWLQGRSQDCILGGGAHLLSQNNNRGFRFYLPPLLKLSPRISATLFLDFGKNVIFKINSTFFKLFFGVYIRAVEAVLTGKLFVGGGAFCRVIAGG